MHPPQRELAEHHRRAAEAGHRTILLTSRGPEFRVGHERELRRMRLRLRAQPRLPVPNVPRGTYLPYDPEDPEEDGLTASEIVALQAAGTQAGELRERACS